jgi:hypothetical protein
VSDLETVVRPFAERDVTPTPFHPAGAAAVAPVRISVGLKGGTKTFAFSAASERSTRMGNKHKETPPASESLQNAIASAASGE